MCLTRCPLAAAVRLMPSNIVRVRQVFTTIGAPASPPIGAVKAFFMLDSIGKAISTCEDGSTAGDSAAKGER